ncbi:MAG: mucoidy inhibitor MuiA family protein [Candidatus Methylacidiphilales bacterium]|nr:mucoidy inhibitor MuiA family protein [Candidatus Methylacidiphilales bacterium]
MKTHPAPILLALLSSVIGVTAAEVKTDHRISEVTVYPDRAVVTRRASTPLTPGEHQIVFENLPIGLDENSVRAGGTGNGWKILGVELKRDYREPSQSPEVLKLRDLIQTTEEKKQDLSDEQNDLNQKRELLNKLSREASSGAAKEGDKPVINVADIQKLVDYYGGEQNKISLRLRAVERTQRNLDKDLEKFRADLAKLENPGNPQNRRVAVTVQADTATTAAVEISYMLANAGWTPQYDVHARGDSDKITLTSYGIVRQRTGENWTDARIVLSTARPQLGTALPDLDPWILQILQPMPAAAPMDSYSSTRELSARKQVLMGQVAQEMRSNRVDTKDEEGASVQLMESNIETRGFSAVFKVPGTTTVPSDGEPHRCTISRQEMSAERTYTATPKLMPGAFVKAKVKNANPAPLLPGALNVFMENDFIGSSALSLVGPEGVFDLFLGKDDGIKVQRKDKVRKEETTGLVNKSRLLKIGYTIEVENLKKTEETLTVKDQIPVAQQDQIKVRPTALNPKPAKENKENGEITWELKLKAREKKVIEVEFEVEAPIGMPVGGI